MRRSTMALSSSLAAIGLSASIALAQQLSQAPALSASPPASDESVDPSMAGRPTRYLLRNGLDYLAYREYARALTFFRAVETRQAELSDAELKSLKKGIVQAQQGMREAVNGNRLVQGKGRATVQPGAFALVKPAEASGSGSAPKDPVQLTSAEMPAPPPLPQTRNLPALPAPIPAAVAMPAPANSDAPVFGVKPAAPVTASVAVELPSLPEAAPVGLPDPSTAPAPAPVPVAAADPVKPDLELPTSPSLPVLPVPTADSSAIPAQASSPIELPPTRPSPSPVTLPTGPPPPLVLESSSPSTSPSPIELPPVKPSPIELPPVKPSPIELPDSNPLPVELPPVGTSPTPVPSEPAPTIPMAVEPSPAPTVLPRVADASQRPDSSAPALPTSIPEPPPAPEAPPARDDFKLPPLPGSMTLDRPAGQPGSILSERLHREVVERIAQRQPGDTRPPTSAPAAEIDDPNAPMAPAQGSTRLELPRAPSPTEARPLRRIPVPEEFVPLGKREWEPNRKYWAAAGTCHMTLYFQDPVLERYGQGVEQALGPIGRYFSYPLDDPRQSNQRNQILQPFYSIGKLCFQVGTLPYKLVVDPPWESEYDLGYYRPGDRIPADTIYITPYGVGPPLQGRNY